MDDGGSEMSDWEVLSAPGGDDDGVLVSGDGGDVVHDHFALVPSDAGFSSEASWSEPGSEEDGEGVEREGSASDWVPGGGGLDLAAEDWSVRLQQVGGVDVEADATGEGSVPGAVEASGAEERRDEAVEQDEDAVDGCGELESATQTEHHGTGEFLGCSDATVAVADVPQLASPENSDVPQLASPENSDVQQLESPENSDVQQLESPENSNVPQLVSPENFDVHQLELPENSDVPQLESKENSDVPEMASLENSDVTQLESKENSDVWQLESLENSDENCVVPQLESPENSDVPQLESMESSDVAQLESSENSDVQLEDGGVDSASGSSLLEADVVNDAMGIAEEEPEQGRNSDAATGCEESDGEAKDSSLPLSQAPGAGEGERQAAVWWRLPFKLLQYSALKAKPVWSFSIAAALLGLVVLGRRMYRMRRKASGLPQIKIAFDDKRSSQFADRAARLNEAFFLAKRIPMLRTSSGAALPWSMVQER